MKIESYSKKELKKICECGHCFGEHPEKGGCSHKLEVPRNKGKYVQDWCCDCEKFVPKKEKKNER